MVVYFLSFDVFIVTWKGVKVNRGNAVEDVFYICLTDKMRKPP
jgi:hypothetical protein